MPPDRTPDSGRTDFDVFGFETWMGHPPPMARPHRHNEIELTYLWEGHATYLTGARLFQLPQRRLSVFWGAIPHHIVALDRACRLSWMTLPLAWFLQWRLPRKFIERLLAGEWIVDRQSSDIDEPLMLQWHHDRDRKRAAWKDVVALEAEARLLRLAQQALSDNADLVIESSEGAIALVEEIARTVATNYRDPFRIEDMAKKLRRHPNYLMQVFKKRCGMTIGEYLVTMRISHAQRLLATTDRKITDIALDCGFESLNPFYEAFGKLVNMAPGAYRGTHRIEKKDDRYSG